MISISCNVKGADAILHQLAGVRLDAIKGDVSALMDDMSADAAHYPPPVGTYVRTGDLGRGWTDSEPLMSGDATSLMAVLTNSVPYGPFVQGAEDQATMHTGRWRTETQIMDAWEERAAQRIEAALGKLIGA
jgi:hypothetical protein